MARLKQNQNTDKLIAAIRFVLKKRCSLLNKEVTFLEEAIIRLRRYRGAKGSTNKDRLEIAGKVIEILLIDLK